MLLKDVAAHHNSSVRCIFSNAIDPRFVETRATLHALRLGISLGNSFGKIERVNVGELVRYTQMKVR